MQPATHIEQVAPGIFRWTAYSPEHRVELTSHAVRHGEEFLMFDPIPLIPEAKQVLSQERPTAIVLTNGNHDRDAAAWRERLGIPVYARVLDGLGVAGVRIVEPGLAPLEGWEAVGLEGGAPGETAYLLRSCSLVVFGDAVVNLPGRTLELLPDKYCTDPMRLRRMLGALLSAHRFDMALFAHGAPVVCGAWERVASLLR